MVEKDFWDWIDERDEYDTDREVSGIVYRLAHPYPDRTTAQVQSYFYRQAGHFARSLKVLGGRFKGYWGAYVSYTKKGE